MKFRNQIVFLIVSMFLFILFTGCKLDVQKTSGTDDTYDIARFSEQMKAKQYAFENKDIKEGLIPADTKRITIGKDEITIYVYKNYNEAEKEATHIDKNGNYNNGKVAHMIEWVPYPYFFKKGSIIVLYCGQNSKMIADLKEILGEPFAGHIQQTVSKK